MQSNALHLFQGFGIELEYMIVDKRTLDVKPICDSLLYMIAGEYLTEVNCGEISYSNELALHVVELKTSTPTSSLHGLDNHFQEHVIKINALLGPHNAKLLPTAAHPWMNPLREMRLWEHEHNAIYESYHRIFDCRGHGWANLQSAHINLPFCGDQEFAALHEAVRTLLPILPALAASSPILEGKKCSSLDARLDTYRFNQQRLPSITGKVVPERCLTIKDYHKQILEPMYKEIAPHDSEGILQYEWLNSRGAIARFDRSTIEIRVLDVQECPKADIAIMHAIVFVLKQLTAKYDLAHLSLESLSAIFLDCVRDAEKAIISDVDYLRIFDVHAPITAQQLWKKLLQPLLSSSDPQLAPVIQPLKHIVDNGCLASRILRMWKMSPTKKNLYEVYEKLSDCLATGSMF